MVKAGFGLGVTVLVLAVAVAAAVWGPSIWAGGGYGTDGPSSHAYVPLQASGGEEAGGGSGRAFLGVVLSDERPPGSTDSSGVVVLTVLEEGPSAGVLSDGDVISAVDGEAVTTFRNVIAKVKAAQPGDAMTIRGKGDVRVTLGERPWELDKSSCGQYPGTMTQKPGLPGFSKGLWTLIGLFGAWNEAFIRGEVVLETEDGFKTIRGVMGMMESIDAGAGRFTLSLSDASAPVEYRVGAETVVVPGGPGDTGALRTDERTLVVDVNGDVVLVLQGEKLAPRMGSKLGHASAVFKFEYDGGHGPGGSWSCGEEILWSYFHDMVLDGEMSAREELERLLQQFPPEIRERLEGHLSEFEKMKDATSDPYGQGF